VKTVMAFVKESKGYAFEHYVFVSGGGNDGNAMQRDVPTVAD
jgi:hypothetical protein